MYLYLYLISQIHIHKILKNLDYFIYIYIRINYFALKGSGGPYCLDSLGSPLHMKVDCLTQSSDGRHEDLLEHIAWRSGPPRSHNPRSDHSYSRGAAQHISRRKYKL